MAYTRLDLNFRNGFDRFDLHRLLSSLLEISRAVLGVSGETL
jgi:hypothetical protein